MVVSVSLSLSHSSSSTFHFLPPLLLWTTSWLIQFDLAYRIWRRKRREREARYHQLDPIIEGPWVKTKTFDPYAETDFRTPTNQLEFEVTTPPSFRSSYNPSMMAPPSTPGYSDAGSHDVEQRVRYSDEYRRVAAGGGAGVSGAGGEGYLSVDRNLGEDGDSLRSRAPSGYSDATVVGDEEVRKLGGSPGYGVKGEK